MSAEEIIAQIKRETFGVFKNSRRVWMIEERSSEFIVHFWTGCAWKNGEGVGPPSEYPTLRKATARFLQLLGIGPVAPQTWPEEVCIGTINTGSDTADDRETTRPAPAPEGWRLTEDQIVMAIIEAGGCGCTVNGKRVPCDYPGAQDSVGRTPTDCTCRDQAKAVMALAAAPPPPQVTDGWLDISSAPKDGTRILVVWPGGGIGVAWWKTNPRLDRKMDAEEATEVAALGWQVSYFSDSIEMDDYDTSIPSSQPTHWQPLPEPPQGEGN